MKLQLARKHLSGRLFGRRWNLCWVHTDPLTSHSGYPKSWPWWRLLSIWHCYLNMDPTHGSRWWVYTRWGSPYLDVWTAARSKAT